MHWGPGARGAAIAGTRTISVLVFNLKLDVRCLGPHYSESGIEPSFTTGLQRSVHTELCVSRGEDACHADRGTAPHGAFVRKKGIDIERRGTTS